MSNYLAGVGTGILLMAGVIGWQIARGIERTLARTQRPRDETEAGT